MYELRIKYSKSDPMNYVSKLMMLYGRFAMKPITNVNQFCSFDDFKKLSEQFEIIDFIDLGELLFVDFINPELINKDHKVSIGISSAVTAYSRVFMSQFKNNDKFNLYYTDTDSIFVDKELDSSLVSNELGKFKLEYEIKEGVFLGPKIYSIITKK